VTSIIFLENEILCTQLYLSILIFSSNTSDLYTVYQRKSKVKIPACDMPFWIPHLRS